MCKQLQEINSKEYNKDNISDCTDELFYSCSIQQFKIAGKYVVCRRKGDSDSTCRNRDNDKCIHIMIKALKDS